MFDIFTLKQFIKYLNSSQFISSTLWSANEHSVYLIVKIHVRDFFFLQNDKSHTSLRDMRWDSSVIRFLQNISILRIKSISTCRALTSIVKFLSDLQRLAFTSTVLQPKRIRSYIDFSEVCLSQLMWASYLQIIEYLNEAIFDMKLDSKQTIICQRERGCVISQ